MSDAPEPAASGVSAASGAAVRAFPAAVSSVFPGSPRRVSPVPRPSRIVPKIARAARTAGSLPGGAASARSARRDFRAPRSPGVVVSTIAPSARTTGFLRGGAASACPVFRVSRPFVVVPKIARAARTDGSFPGGAASAR